MKIWKAIPGEVQMSRLLVVAVPGILVLALSACGNPGGNAPGVEAQPLTAKNALPVMTGLLQLEASLPTFLTPGGYVVSAEGVDEAWRIATPNNRWTRIWGHPHVNESDGGTWDFKKGMSFVLPDGTKITANTTPPKENGYTVTESIDIMNGGQRATIEGIDANQPQTTGIKNDRWAADARTPDGLHAVLGGDGDDWFLGGKNEIVEAEVPTQAPKSLPSPNEPEP
jgi:hypothetical protein